MGDRCRSGTICKVLDRGGCGDGTDARRAFECQTISRRRNLHEKQASFPLEETRRYLALGFRPVSEFVDIEPGYEGILENVFIGESFPLNDLELLLQTPVPANLVSRDGLS